MKQILCILLSVLGWTTGMTQNPYQIKGKVDCENKGIHGVVVSDGKNCVQTDEQGNYSLDIDNESQFVFISTPAGYLTEIKENTIPLFYEPIDRSSDKKYDFHLKKNPHDDLNHVFLHKQMSKPFLPKIWILTIVSKMTIWSSWQLIPIQISSA